MTEFAVGGAATTSVSAQEALGAAWLFGLVLFLAPIAARLWQLRRIRRRAVPWMEGQAVVKSLAADCGISRHVAVLRDESIRGPVTCGFFQPAILFPCDAEEWTPDALRRALVHELEHVRRADSRRTAQECYCRRYVSVSVSVRHRLRVGPSLDDRHEQSALLVEPPHLGVFGEWAGAPHCADGTAVGSVVADHRAP